MSKIAVVRSQFFALLARLIVLVACEQIYYSLYNHTKTLAEEVAKGARENGAHVDIYQGQFRRACIDSGRLTDLM